MSIWTDRLRAVLFAAIALPLASCGSGAPVAANLTLDAGVEHQTFEGFEVTAQGGQFECPVYASYRDELVERAVAFGVDRVRLEVVSGSEHPVDHHARFAAGEISFGAWHDTFYPTENDDADPRHRNDAGFHFGGLDATVRELVLPLRDRLRAADPPRELYVNLCYVAFDGGGELHRADPEEYAEFVTAAFEHLRSTFDLVPDGLEIVLEPDVGGWSAREVAAVIAPAAKRLEAAGFDPQIHAPSTTSMGGALDYLAEIEKRPEALAALDVVTYHRYRSVGRTQLEGIRDRARAAGKGTAMLEHIDSGVEALLDDVLIGGNVSWQQFALAFPTGDNGAQLFSVVVDGNAGRLESTSHGRRLLHFAPLLRRGSVRLEFGSDHADVRGIAVRQGDRVRLAVWSPRKAQIRIAGLPVGSYQAFRTGSDGRRMPAGEPQDLGPNRSFDFRLAPGEAMSLVAAPR